METVNSSGLVDQVYLRCVEDCFEPIMITDLSGHLRYVNPAWISTYGFSKEEAVGNTPRLLRSEGQAPEFYKTMWQTILDPKIGFWRGQVLNRAKDGHVVPVLLTITPYRHSSGEIAGYMGIAIDLTDQKKMEQQILRQDRLASIGMLAGGLAHEIGNPLGVIRGRAELVMHQVKDNEAAVKNLEVVVGQIDRISGLIQSLLRVSRVPEQILLRPVDLRPSVEEVFDLMHETSRAAGVDLRLNNLDFKISSDPSHLQQLLLNLVINAFHAIEERKQKHPESTQQDFIEVSSEVKGDGRCLVSIRDSGCGISPDNVRRLFQPFFTTKAAGKGTGLGLAIVSRLIEEMDGKVFVKSEGVGKGATFTLEFKTSPL
jgi:two-component system cell cycle sensor histidine kinase/response regulator CckA